MAPSNAIETNGIEPAARNVLNVVFGEMLFKTWYPSFYPEDLAGKETQCLYVCRWCYKYAVDPTAYLAHTVCPTFVDLSL